MFFKAWVTSGLPTMLGSQARDLWFLEGFVSTREHARTALNFKLQLTTWSLWNCQWPSRQWKKSLYSRGHGVWLPRGPGLLLQYGCMERDTGTWDIPLHLLVLSYPVITANRKCRNQYLMRARQPKTQTPSEAQSVWITLPSKHMTPTKAGGRREEKISVMAFWPTATAETKAYSSKPMTDSCWCLVETNTVL